MSLDTSPESDDSLPELTSFAFAHHHEYSQYPINVLLLQARDAALKAVTFDNVYRLQEALVCYRELNERLDDVLHNILILIRKQKASISRTTSLNRRKPQLDNDIVMVFHAVKGLRNNYTQRVSTILDYLPIESTAFYAAPKLNYSDISLFPPCADTSSDTFMQLINLDCSRFGMWAPLSIDAHESKFEFFGRISNSITVGDFVSEGLFISPILWCHKVSGLESKILAFSDLSNVLSQLESLQSIGPCVGITVELDKSIEHFEKTIDIHKAVLVKKLKGYSENSISLNVPFSNNELSSPIFPNNPNIRRQFSHKVSGLLKKSLMPSKIKSRQSEPMSQYCEVMAVFLKKSANVFGTFLKASKNQDRKNIDIRARLNKVIKFYHQVIYVIVINDLSTLLDRFATRSILEYLPKNII